MAQWKQKVKALHAAYAAPRVAKMLKDAKEAQQLDLLHRAKAQHP